MEQTKRNGEREVADDACGDAYLSEARELSTEPRILEVIKEGKEERKTLAAKLREEAQAEDLRDDSQEISMIGELLFKCRGCNDIRLNTYLKVHGSTERIQGRLIRESDDLEEYQRLEAKYKERTRPWYCPKCTDKFWKATD